MGQERVGVRLAPFGTFQEMGKEPLDSFVYVCQQLKGRFPRLAYVHVIEDIDRWLADQAGSGTNRSTDPLRAVFHPSNGQGGFDDPSPGETVFLSCSDYGRDTATSTVEAKGGIVAAGRRFIANPDLPARWLHDYPLTPWHRPTFYTPGPEGYITYTEHVRA